MIKIQNLYKDYLNGENSFRALENIDLEINNGEFVAIMGQSGSGKSTLLNLIAGFDSPTQGHIWIDQLEISNMSENQKSKIRGDKISFVFQSFHLLPDITTLDNVIMPLLIKGIRYNKAKEIALKYINLVGLSNKLNNKPDELSGGQKQRVAIARSLVLEPSILLADEPTGNLDSQNGREILDLLKELSKTNHIIIILVTHSQKAADYADKIIYLLDGKIVDNISGGV